MAKNDIKLLIKNNNILTDNLIKHGWQPFFDGKKQIAYNRACDTIEIRQDKSNNKYFCYFERQNGNIYQYILFYDKDKTTLESKDKLSMTDILAIYKENNNKALIF